MKMETGKPTKKTARNPNLMDLEESYSPVPKKTSKPNPPLRNNGTPKKTNVNPPQKLPKKTPGPLKLDNASSKKNLPQKKTKLICAGQKILMIANSSNLKQKKILDTTFPNNIGSLIKRAGTNSVICGLKAGKMAEVEPVADKVLQTYGNDDDT